LNPDQGRRLAVVVIAIAAVVVIGVLVIRASTSDTSSKDGGPVSSHLIRAGDIGDLKDELALRAAVEPALRGSARQRSGSEPLRCTAEARKLQPAGAVLTYEAAARWQGSTAEVFGFSPPGAPATSSGGRPAQTRLYVLARADCRLLVFQSYAP
jgi:hypothetical protein